MLAILEGRFFMADSSPGFQASHHPSTPVRVLIAEDHPMHRRVIQILMSEFGVFPVLAEDGGKALELYRANAYDLVLLDIQMPELDGLDTLSAMKKIDQAEQRKAPRYLAFTANVLDVHRTAYLAAGFDEMLSKPVTADDISRVLELVSPR
jgi:CheY-like chemotaxis protein